MPRYSLRTLFVVVTVAAVFLGIVAMAPPSVQRDLSMVLTYCAIFLWFAMTAENARVQLTWLACALLGAIVVLLVILLAAVPKVQS